MGGNQSSEMGSTVEPYGDIGFFGALANKQTYLNLAYLMLTFPLGIFYFVFIVVGLSLGLGLVVIWVGLLILLAMMVAMRGLATW